MRNELAEVEEYCRAILSGPLGEVDWEWDDYVGAMLAVVKRDNVQEVFSHLDNEFASTWTEQDLRSAPRNVQRLSVELGGIRRHQYLFVTPPEDDTFAYAAWWPWGDGETFSLRLGLVCRNVGDFDAEQYRQEFLSWFPRVRAKA